jgi:N-acetylglutamate synthase
MSYLISQMTINDYEEAVDLWKRCEGIGLSDADERAPINRFLNQNEGLCFVARSGEKLVGTCLCGSDGRRGYLYHLAVDPDARRQGIGQALAAKSLAELKLMDIHKCHIMVYAKNDLGLKFWSKVGWKLRPEIEVMSFDLESSQKCGSC